MEKIKNESSKKRKVVIGIATVAAVAAIAVPTALTLTNAGRNADASKENKYNVVVSCGLENVPDYSLSITEGTRIGELKVLLKAIDGYRITGIFKDEAMIHEYADNEFITSNTKIYIEFTSSVYTVNIYSEDGETLIESREVSHNDSLVLTEPTKPGDGFATYEFAGWVNERGDVVNLNAITSDMNIRPSFKLKMKEYHIGYIGGDFKDSLLVTVGEKPISINDSFHHGSIVKIRANQRPGREITEFKIKIGSSEAIDVLSEFYRYESKDGVYYEIEFTGNDDISITYNEAAEEYSLGAIPEGVSVVRNGNILSSSDILYYGDMLEIKYNLEEDYNLDAFEVSGAEFVHGTNSTYKVVGDTNIVFESSFAYDYLEFDEVSDGYMVSGFNNESTRVVIPNKYNGLPVTEIGSEVFMDSDITSITIGENVKRIGSQAFYNCQYVTELRFNAIEADPFLIYGQSGPELLLNVFVNLGKCSEGTRLIFGDSVKKVPDGLFYCVDMDNGDLLPANIKSVEFGKNIEEIGMYSIIFTQAESFNLPASLKTIGEAAFGANLNITSIVIPNSVTSIGGSAFVECASLSSITLPDGLTSISYSMFQGCASLTNINLPSGIQFIGSYAFDGTNLKSITLPESLKVIDSDAFNGLESLESIVIPKNVEEIGRSAFYRCNNLTNVTIESAEIYKQATSYSSIGYLIQNAKTLRFLASAVDRSNEFLEKNESRQEGNYIVYDLTYSYLTFEECEGGYELASLDSNFSSYNKTEIVIPATFKGKKVVSIKNSAFSNGYNITSIVLPEGLESIGDNAFSNCKLTSLVIPSTVNSIGKNFVSHEKLESIKVANGNSKYTSCDLSGNEINAIIDKTSKTLILGCNTTVMPSDNSITAIGNYAFYQCSKLTSVSIPEGVTYIGQSAFSSCSSLRNISIPNSIEIIENQAFSSCNSLTYNTYDNAKYLGNSENPYLVLFKATSTSIVSCEINSGCKIILDSAFGSCRSLESLVIPSSVVFIGATKTFSNNRTIKGYFSDCSGLTSIQVEEGNSRYTSRDLSGNEVNALIEKETKTLMRGCANTIIPSDGSVSSIGDFAFSDCTGLTEIVIPNNITSIGSYAFSSCTGLTEIVIPNSVTSIGENAFAGCKNLISITLPEGLTSIGSYLFYGCSSLTEIVIPNSVTSIGSSAFYGCTGLTEIVIPNSVKEIGSSAFNGCSSLTEIAIPNSVTSIGSSAFNGCTNLTKVTLPEGLTKIESYSFENCSNLIEIVIPSSVKEIGNSAFKYCRNLNSINLPDGLTKIGDSAFYECSSLSEIVIPNSVTILDRDAFRGCYNLTSITLSNNITTIDYSTFENCSKLTSIVIPEGVTTISGSAFSYCSNLTSVSIPNSITSIDSSTFGNCNKLQYNTYGNALYLGNSENPYLVLIKASSTSIYECEINSGCKIIAQRAFQNCSNLGSIVIPEGVITICNGAFEYCNNLKTVSLPSTLVTIENYAFGYCRNLESIVIPSSVKTVDSYAFTSCDNLKTITIESADFFKNSANDYETNEIYRNAKTIYVLKSIDDSRNKYLNNNGFKKTEDGNYNVYTR